MTTPMLADRPALYQAARRFVNEGLRRDGCLFEPGRPVWRVDVIDDFHERYVVKFDDGSETFRDKLVKQLAGASADVAQYAGELLFVHALAAHGMRGMTVEQLVRTALEVAPGTVPIPDGLRPAMDVGIARTGPGLHTHRFRMVRFLHEFVRAWKRDLRDDDRERLLTQPWAFHEFLFSLAMHAAQTQRAALLHLVFPDTFEPIVSERHKTQIVAAFDTNPSDPSDDVDRRLARIRAMMAERFGEDFHYYQPNVVEHWRKDSDGPLQKLIGWTRRFFEWEGFDAAERDWKLAFAAKLQLARRSLENGESAWDQVLTALRGTNLVSRRVVDGLQGWLSQNADRADRALRTLWLGEGELRERIDGFAEQMADAPIGEKVRFTAALLMALDPTEYPPYAKTALQRAYALTRFGEPPATATAGQRYEHARGFFSGVLEEAEADGLELRDLLDAQGVVWSVVSYRPDFEPVSTWSKSERRQFLKFRGDPVEAGDGDDREDEDRPDAPPAALGRTDLAALAHKLLLPESFLADIRRLLKAKRQVILYGPPGTGKTYVARELAAELAGRDRVRLVQFHPSYTYEDFVEGYRPVASNGEFGFSLVPGALKRIAQEAAADPSNTHILIIDELNRGNVAKVFGELYFLLEYRNESMDLQYSRELFRLPDNLWFIGTMNTADRSIALMDTALRRRFYFVPFFPDQEPIRGLLSRWLAREKPALAWVADVVEEANRRLDDPHFAIGPSHFMRPDLDERWVGLIWAHAIQPTLEELFFDRAGEVGRFALSALRPGSEPAARQSIEEPPDPAPSATD